MDSSHNSHAFSFFRRMSSSLRNSGGGGGGGGIMSSTSNNSSSSSSARGFGGLCWGDGGGGSSSSGGYSGPPRSFWTKYCLLCTLCGSAATILAGIFLVVAALFRYYTTSINYLETVPTYLPAVLLSIVGVSTIAFSCKRNRNIILLRITACWSLLSAALSSVMTITTSLIHMNRLQTLKECVYNHNPPACSCYSHVFPMTSPPDSVTYVFENTPDCEVIHGILYSCLRAVFAISVVAVLLSIFLCMLLYQLIGHERKKAYWSRIRRINSDWGTDYIACLARNRGNGVLPAPSGHPPAHLGWGPPPPYEESVEGDPPTLSTRPFLRPLFNHHRQEEPVSSIPLPPSRMVTSHSENSFNPIRPHPFSPTITMDPSALMRHSHSQGEILGTVGVNCMTTPMNMSIGFGPSMSSITSFSIPSSTTFRSRNSLLSTAQELTEPGTTTRADPDDLAQMDDLPEEEGDNTSKTCRSVASGSVFNDEELEDDDDMGTKSKLLDLEQQIKILEEKLAKLESRRCAHESTDDEDEGGLVPPTMKTKGPGKMRKSSSSDGGRKRRASENEMTEESQNNQEQEASSSLSPAKAFKRLNNSLPSTPLMHVRRFLMNRASYSSLNRITNTKTRSNQNLSFSNPLSDDDEEFK